MRQDIYCINDSGAFTITHGRQCGCGIDQPGEEEWLAAVQAGKFIPLSLAGDDYNTWRVVLDEPLNNQEQAEWIGRLHHRLSVPDGKLVIAGGCEVIYEEIEDEDDKADAFSYCSNIVEIPQGLYRAEIYTYIHSLNAVPMLDYISPLAPEDKKRKGSYTGFDEAIERIELALRGPKKAREPLGTWFRRTRPGEEFPDWLWERCRLDPGTEDPGYEEEWKKAERHECETSQAYVGYLLHLTRCDDEPALPPCPPLEAGFFELDAYTLRKPDLFPPGLDALPSNLPEQAEPYIPRPLEILSYLQERNPEPLAGGSLITDIKALVRLFQIAEICHPHIHPELLVRLPDAVNPHSFPATHGPVFYSDRGNGELGIAFGTEDYRPAAWLAEVSADLASLPPDSSVELVTAHCQGEGADLAVAPGFLRFRGQLGSGGVWRIDATYPGLSRAFLEEAMALAAALDQGAALTLHDSEEAEALVAALCRDRGLSMMFEYSGNPVRIEGSALVLEEPDRRLMEFLCRLAFRQRGYNASLPMMQEEEEDDEDEWEQDEDQGEIMSLVDWFDKTAVYDPTDKVPVGPVQGELLFRDPQSWLNFTYVRTDALALGKASKTRVEATDRALAALGYTPCGDILCLAGDANTAMRGYACPNGTSYGSLAIATQARGVFGWISRLADGSYLSTTQQPALRDDPERGLYAISRPDPEIAFAELLHLHEERVAALASHHGAPCPAEATTLALVRWVDEFQNKKYRDTPLGMMMRIIGDGDETDENAGVE